MQVCKVGLNNYSNNININNKKNQYSYINTSGCNIYSYPNEYYLNKISFGKKNYAVEEYTIRSR